MSRLDPVCFIKSCNAPVSGRGGRTPHYLCERHLEQDKERVFQLRDTVHQKLLPIKTQRDRRRVEQETLAAELQEAEELLTDAVESIMTFKKVVTDRLSARHESALEMLRSYAVLQEYECAVASAEESNDLRKVFELASEMELESGDFMETHSDAQLIKEARPADQVTRIMGDVSGGLRDLRVLIDRQLQNLLQSCETVDAPGNTGVLSEPLYSIENLPASPAYVVACTNTSGYFGDSAKRLVKSAVAEEEGWVSLLGICLFVLFQKESNRTSILVTSVDGLVTLECQSAINWTSYPTALHCDSKRQLLFIVQADSVTMTDLSGQVSQVVNSESLGQTVRSLCGIDGNSDKIFVFDQLEKKILGIGKDKGDLHSVICVQHFYESPVVIYQSLSVFGNAVYLTDIYNNRVYKICTVSKKLITSYPTKLTGLPQLSAPSCVATNSSGLVFVSESAAHTVSIMMSNGTILGTIGVRGQVGSGIGRMQIPWGMAFVPGDVPMLAVCQNSGNCISVYKMRV